MSLLLHVTLQRKPNAPPRLLQNFQKFTRETEPTTLSNLFSLGEGGWFGRPRGSGFASAIGRRGGASNLEMFPSAHRRTRCRKGCRPAGRNGVVTEVGRSVGSALGPPSVVAPDTRGAS